MKLGYETETVEFKKSTGELKEGVISISSMLNKHGEAVLYFGVKNDGSVIGQQIGDSTLRDVSQAIVNHIKPQV
ncbi:MAG: ATP-binding protein, partial [Acidaminococcaceae bacterium]|nr:ATP-binding protein [Acidaminococcaceae bacterium]